ncbi:hypothetical protein HK099_001133 [Clydaea vesicula]|uniref:Methyltransferase domain-containing protein n=1 Tax=Clydaea vesicula TaxID=447962 RepID=A0AAD5XZ26_9FUNG|nr:hypothetical protein HK099_001133 [Clydaea vesicula]
MNFSSVENRVGIILKLSSLGKNLEFLTVYNLNLKELKNFDNNFSTTEEVFEIVFKKVDSNTTIGKVGDLINVELFPELDEKTSLQKVSRKGFKCFQLLNKIEENIYLGLDKSEFLLELDIVLWDLTLENSANLGMQLLKIMSLSFSNFNRHEFFTKSEELKVMEEINLKSKANKKKDFEMNTHEGDFHLCEKVEKTKSDKEFTKWIIKTFGKSYLQAGSGVIDIAGGKGHITFQLHCIENINCTLVEPREVILRSWQRKLIKKQNLVTFQHKKNFFNKEFCLESSNTEMLKNCSILIGMHPDQATDEIVDFALKNWKSFAVVPCCVFSNLFPNRRTSAGKHVRTYQEYIDYLLGKHADIKKDFLNSEGRNIIIYLKN